MYILDSCSNFDFVNLNLNCLDLIYPNLLLQSVCLILYHLCVLLFLFICVGSPVDTSLVLKGQP